MTISQILAQLQLILANQGGCVKLAKAKRNPFRGKDVAHANAIYSAGGLVQ